MEIIDREQLPTQLHPLQPAQSYPVSDPDSNYALPALFLQTPLMFNKQNLGNVPPERARYTASGAKLTLRQPLRSGVSRSARHLYCFVPGGIAPTACSGSEEGAFSADGAEPLS
jgi:hypothetical protein